MLNFLRRLPQPPQPPRTPNLRDIVITTLRWRQGMFNVGNVQAACMERMAREIIADFGDTALDDEKTVIDKLEFAFFASEFSMFEDVCDGSAP